MHYDSRILATTYPGRSAKKTQRLANSCGIKATYRTMKHNWIKFVFERKTYVVDLDCIASFARAENGRLMFSLPGGKVAIVIHSQTNPEVYQEVLDYLDNLLGADER